jgi:hypothetical protein
VLLIEVQVSRYLKPAKRLILYMVTVLAMISPIKFACGSPVQQFILSQSLNQASGDIGNFFISPQTDTVGRRTVYSIDFVVSGDTLTPGATLQLYFPIGFVFSALDSVTYFDNDTGNTNFGIAGISSSPGLLSVRLSESGEAPAIGSKITLRLFGLESSVVAATYQLILAIISAENELIASPTWSSIFELVPDRITVFRLLPEGIQQVHAGTTLRYQVESFDQYSNPITAQPIQWSVIGLPVQTGTIVDGDFQARFTGASRIVASYGEFADTSKNVYVLPGVFAYFGFTGGPDMAIAGVGWSDEGSDVVVTAYDIFGNVNDEFSGEIYFQASDVLAELPFTAASQYRFLPSDLGRHTFRGSTFRFFTAGRHDLFLMKNGVVQQTLRSISVQPGTVSSFSVSTPETVTAGASFMVTITDAIDSWRNTVSSRVDLSLASGSGIAPSGGLPSLPSFLVTGGSGSASTILVNSGVDSLQCSLGGKLIRRPVVVIADSLAGFDFQLDSPQVIGKPFVGVALLTALDRFGNTITSFSAQSDSITISASGTGRVFNNVIAQPYAFVNGRCDLKTIGTGYSGEALYSSFTATSRSGKRGVSPTVAFSVLKITGGALVSEKTYIGEQFIFNLTISNFGSQQAVVDSIRIYGDGDRLSPLAVSRLFPDTISPLSNRLYGFTGTTPNRPNQSLGFSAQFFGRIGTVSVADSVSNLATLTILPPEVVSTDSLASFDFQLDSPQVIGKPFVGVALLTALDRFGNTITSFSAQSDSITISASGTGRVFNNVIAQPYAFVNGRCDLKTIGTGYSGEALYSSFTATSRSGKKGVSPTVAFSVLKITGGALVSEKTYIGEQFIFNLTISNFGSQQAVVDSIRISGDGDRLSPLTVNRLFPDTIAPLSNRLYSFAGTTPNRPNQSLGFSAQFFGRIGAVSVTDSISNLATLTILPPEGISTIAQTLSPQQVTRGREYGFSLRIRNDSDDDLRLTPGTQLLLGAGAHPTIMLTLEGLIVIPAKTESALLRFAPSLIPSIEADSLEDISVHLVGTLGSISYDHTLPTFATVVTQTPPALSYQAASFAPTTIYRGKEITPALDAVNTGTASLLVNVAVAELAFYAAARSLTTRLEAAQLALAKGVSRIAMKPLFVPADFPMVIDSLVLDISGTANGHTESFRLRLSGDVTSIPSGAAVQIVSTHNSAVNAPYVNIGQLFSIEVHVRNMGDEPLRDVVLRMASDGSSIHADSVTVRSLAVAGDTTIRFDIEAAVTASSSELFSTTISHALGESSGLSAQILPSVNSTQVVVIQTPASLSLVSAISAPVEAQDGDVKPSTSFVLSASVNNGAQAAVGGGELTMSIIAGSFSTVDAPTRSFEIGQEVAWTIVAPPDADTGRFEIAISAIPQGNNTGMVAGVVNRVDTIVMVSSEIQVALGVDFVPLQAALLSAGRTYEMLTLNFDVVGASEKPYLDFIDFALLDRAHYEIDPSLVLTAADLRYNDQSTVAGIITGGRYRFELGEGLGTPRSATISLSLRADPQMADCSLYLDSNSFAAAYRTPAGAKPVPISARFASRLIIKEDVTLVPSGLDKSFFSYPNPFSPLTETATIVYSLAAAKPAVLTIYTLTGDKVITRNLPAPAALDQPVTVSWNGRNGDGQIVLNGIYIAVLSIEGEPEVRTKIAVMK